MSAAHYYGELIPVEQTNGYMTFMLNNVQLENPPGTSEIINEIKYDYVSNESRNMVNGTRLVFYPVGTSLEQLPTENQWWVSDIYYGTDSNNNLTTNIISNGKQCFAGG